MLSFILGEAQRYERKHGRRPNVVFLSPKHHEILAREYPQLLAGDSCLSFGFALRVLPECTHPYVAFIAGVTCTALDRPHDQGTPQNPRLAAR